MNIVILHGWGKGAESFSNLKKILEEKGTDVYLFDLPGFGKEKEPSVPWSVSDYVSFVEVGIKEKNISDFHLFGHSFGGRIAIKLASENPSGLKGLILCDAAGVTPRAKKGYKIIALLAKAGKAVFSLPVLNFAYGIARYVFYRLLRGNDYYSLETEVMRKTFKKIIAEDLIPYLSKIKKPTLIIWGAKDMKTPLSDAYAINKEIRGSSLKILDGIGHSPHLESPEKLAELVHEFIRNNS